jgi:hypothetical protein
MLKKLRMYRLVLSLAVFGMQAAVFAQPGDLSALLEAENAAGPVDRPTPANPDGSAETTVEPDTRSPVPPPDAVLKATRTVAAIYDQKLAAARRPTDRTAVAREMLGAVVSIKDVTERYALLQAALKVAGTGEDLALVQQIAKSLSVDYVVSELALTSAAVKTLAPPSSPETWRETAKMLETVAVACLDAERYQDASEVISVYMSMARRMRDPKHVTVATSLKKQLTERKKAGEKLRQLTESINAGDANPKAFLEAGKILCFERGDWAQGLRYLAKGEDPVLSRVALLDLNARTPEQRLAVAEAWATFAETANGSDRPPSLDRVASILASVIPKLQGLTKVKAETALDTALQSMNKGDRDPNSWIVVFRSSKPDAWNTDSQGEANDYAIPVAQLPANIKFLRIRRGNGEGVVIPITKASLLAEVAGENFGWNGTKADTFGALSLGIFDRNADVNGKTGNVVISRKGGLLSGWGFGHRVHHGGAAEVCWASKWIPREVLEISVLTRSLTPAETRQLLD